MAKQVPYKVRLHIFSPVHIGCDDVYEPTGFVVDKVARQLHPFDPLDFVRTLPPADQATFLAICDKGTLESIIEVYRFMAKCAPRPEWRTIPVPDGFLASYERVLTKLNPRKELDIKQELNKFLIARTSYLPMDHLPYIPGSSLKGALRTGWLNARNKGQKQNAGNARQMEESLMGGSFASDPFRLVKISDLLPVGRPGTRICFAVNKKKKPSKYDARGPQQILEVIRHDTHCLFEGIITIHEPETGTPIRQAHAVPADRTFFSGATEFFVREMSSDEELLKGINIPSGVQRAMEMVFGDRFLKDVFPVRIGRHSGAECVTVEGARKVRIMGKQGQPAKIEDHSTTLWLAGDSPKAENNLLPFGWSALEVLPLDSEVPYPTRVFTDKPVILASGQSNAVAQPARQPVMVEHIVWPSALLKWSPGNCVLTASYEGEKAEISISGDRSMVPASLHKKLFEKRAATPARVTLEKEGNYLRIVLVEVV